jgi:hypothetical protein
MRGLRAALAINGSYLSINGSPDTPIVSAGVSLWPRDYEARHGAFVASKSHVGIHDLAKEDPVNLTLVGSTRADDIVRDADILHLYKRAGFERFPMGMDSTEEATLRLIRKGGATGASCCTTSQIRSERSMSLPTAGPRAFAFYSIAASCRLMSGAGIINVRCWPPGIWRRGA